MKKLPVFATVAAILASISPSQAQFSDRYAIWRSDHAVTEKQIGQNCLGAYRALEEFPYLTTLFEQDGNDLAGFDPARDVFTIRAKALPIGEDAGEELVVMMALQIGTDVTSDKDLFRHTGIAREVFAIVAECQAHFAIPATVRFEVPPPPRAPTDRECGVRYATLLHYNSGAVSRAIFSTRAHHAAEQVRQANPALNEQEIFLLIDSAGQKAAGELTIGQAPAISAVRDAYRDAAACDVRYGFPPTPVPDGIAEMADKLKSQ